jgi:hypothetical protein
MSSERDSEEGYAKLAQLARETEAALGSSKAFLAKWREAKESEKAIQRTMAQLAREAEAAHELSKSLIAQFNELHEKLVGNGADK